MASPATQHAALANVDIASIVEKVMRRLQEQSHTETKSTSDAHVITDRVISVETIDRLPAGVRSIEVAGGIVTPAAKDELKSRGITLASSTVSTSIETGATGTGKRFVQLQTDLTSRDIRDAWIRQLNSRGIDHCPRAQRTVIATKHPAKTLLAQIQSGAQAVLITRLSDVQRFASEVSADTFVLDMERLNLIELVNAAGSIARLPKRSQTVEATR
ncbi:hypothetical protein LOC71_01365 [Rhodopirellula sp. JC740]|uniref:Uncharacterized protein n=1 Tax=Rhodopirellula halodulae TaxID=2894198 RepID=A0ABS8NDI6_9BACT|nr:hypothetical protein [Rhodopirellula sp. JC740]MCC9640903.1 hypothetical protein [Rhodopirellula sp. JC740]